tara:strand:- start:5332 stop:6501 length:1170 start_codon:yes stop_codon:yes gene_type:complete
MKKLISILGSTGSVGLNSTTIIDKNKNYFQPHIFIANKNFKKICLQIRKFKPIFFIINDQKTYQKISKKFKKSKTKILSDFDLIKSKKKSDITISALPGIAGLQPTMKMIKLSKKILLANKETVICGWDLIKKAAKKNNVKIIPVDSEHFAIMRLLKNYKINEINKIYLTASGGPFLNYKLADLKKIKPNEALNHPKWKMGKKISVDSSTLMNKILELIEAQKLFNLPNKKLEILIHPNSLVHAIIELKNGLMEFIYHETSMIIPLANGIFDGKLDIKKYFKVKKKGFKKIQDLFFREVDPKIFPIIKIKKRINEYPSTPIIINASNEILVDRFLQKKIPFLRINSTIMDILNDRNYKKYAIRHPINFNEIYKIDAWARQATIEKVRND